MGDVDPAGTAQRLGDRDHLVGRRHHVRRIVKAGGESGRTLRQRIGQPALHVGGFLVGGGPLRVAAHRLDAQRHVSDQRIGVHRWRLASQTIGVFAEAVERPPGFIAEQVERRHRARCHPHRRQADAAIAHHHGGDALRHLAQHAVRAAQHGAIVMRVRIDEARSQRLAGGDHLAVGRGRAEIAHRHDAVTGDADIGGKRGAPVPSNTVASRMIRSQRNAIVSAPEFRGGGRIECALFVGRDTIQQRGVVRRDQPVAHVAGH